MDKNFLISNSCDAVVRYRLATDNALQTLYESLKELVKNCGGLIDTRNNDGARDNIYGLLFDYGVERYEEVYIKAVRLENEEICVLCEPVLNRVKVIYTEEDLTSEAWQDNWYNLQSGEIYYAPTLLSICDCIEQYVKKYTD